MALTFGSKLRTLMDNATAAAKQRATAVLQSVAKAAANGAGAVKNVLTSDNDLPAATLIGGAAAIPVIGPVIGPVLAAGRYALKGSDYASQDAYLDKSLDSIIKTECGDDPAKIEDRRKRLKLRRRKEREALIEKGKDSPDPKVRKAARDLERDMAGVERARLSKHVYDQYDPKFVGPPPQPPTGFLLPTAAELDELKITPEMLSDPNSGFRAQLYKVDPKVGPVPPEYVMAFRGTVGGDDWIKANIPQALGHKSDYYNNAMEIGRILSKLGDRVEFTGHSLGGGLASAASVVGGIKATTQNAAGLHDNTSDEFGVKLDRNTSLSQVNAYRINDENENKTELLTSISKLPTAPNAIGTPIDLNAPKSGVSRYGLHGVDAVIDSIEEQKQKQQQLLSE
jgi:hypothetical protein